jgi:hypothetical protein
MRAPSVSVSRSGSVDPILTALGCLIAFAVVANAGTLILDAVTALDGKARDVLSEAALAAFVLVVIAALAWWRSTGFSTPRPAWRHLRLLVLPIALTLLPFLGGVKAGVDGSTIALLVVGYALNSVAEGPARARAARGRRRLIRLLRARPLQQHPEPPGSVGRHHRGAGTRCRDRGHRSRRASAGQCDDLAGDGHPLPR